MAFLWFNSFASLNTGIIALAGTSRYQTIKKPGPLKQGLTAKTTTWPKGLQTSRQVRLLPVRIKTFRPVEQRLSCFVPLKKRLSQESRLPTI